MKTNPILSRKKTCHDFSPDPHLDIGHSLFDIGYSFRISPCRFTLIELIVYGAVFLLISGAALQFFYKTRKMAHTVSRSAIATREIPIIRERFRRFVNHNGSLFTFSPESVSFQNGNRIRIEENSLLYLEGDRTCSQLIPKGFHAQFSREEPDIGSPLLVLTLIPPGSGATPQYIPSRIIAVIPGENPEPAGGRRETPKT